MPADHNPHGSGAENRMRQLLTEHAHRTPDRADGLNADTVIARARRRRRPRQLAAGGVSALALIGVLTIAIPAITSTGVFDSDASMVATTLGESDMEQRDGVEAPESTGMGDFACTGASPSHAVSGFDVTLQAQSATAPGADAAQWTIAAEIVVVNTGTTAAKLDIDAASFALDQNGKTVGAYFGGPESDAVTLEPGEHTSYALSFIPMSCTPGVTLSGEFELSAAVLIGGELAMTEPVAVATP